MSLVQILLSFKLLPKFQNAKMAAKGKKRPHSTSGSGSEASNSDAGGELDKVRAQSISTLSS